MDFQRRRYLHWGIPRSSMTFSFGMMPCTEAQSVRFSTWIMMDQQLLDDPTLGHSRHGEHFSLEHSHPIWILYTGACPSFGGRSDWFLTLGHLPSDMVIIGLFHVVLIAYWGIATLSEVLTLRLGFLFVIAAYYGLWSYRHLGFSPLSILG